MVAPQTLYLDRDGIAVCLSAAGTVLRSGGLVVAPTDTLYGMLGCFSSRGAVEGIYQLKGRDQERRLLALVPDISSAAALSREPLPDFIHRFWPGPLTIILPATAAHPLGWETQAVRVPASLWIQGLLREVGEPLFAPSVNPQGKPPAATIREAEGYFGEMVPLYVGAFAQEIRLEGLPSTIIGWVDGRWRVIREGAVAVDNLD